MLSITDLELLPEIQVPDFTNLSAEWDEQAQLDADEELMQNKRDYYENFGY
jgi:hypothetical protein